MDCSYFDSLIVLFSNELAAWGFVETEIVART